MSWTKAPQSLVCPFHLLLSSFKSSRLRFPSLADHGCFKSVPCLSCFLSLFLFVCLFCLSTWSHFHSLFKHFRLFRADGHEVPVGVWPSDHSVQHLPHLEHRGLHLASSLRPTGQTRKDQRLDCCFQQPVWVATGRRWTFSNTEYVEWS